VFQLGHMIDGFWFCRLGLLTSLCGGPIGHHTIDGFLVWLIRGLLTSVCVVAQIGHRIDGFWFGQLGLSYQAECVVAQIGHTIDGFWFGQLGLSYQAECVVAQSDIILLTDFFLIIIINNKWDQIRAFVEWEPLRWGPKQIHNLQDNRSLHRCLYNFLGVIIRWGWGWMGLLQSETIHNSRRGIRVYVFESW